MSFLLIAVTVLEMSSGGVDLKVDADRTQIDPGRSVFLTVTMKTPKDVKASVPDLRDRVRGFSLAEDFAGKPVKNADGSLVETVNWKLIPEPCADVYKIAPFAVTASPRLLSTAADEGSLSFVAGPIYFENPPARETVTGDMEADPQKDLPPLSWKLVGWCALALFAVVAIVAVVWFLLRYLARRIKEHRMSPIERAWVELDRLLKKGLPEQGRYKDFYVELTMVVRRYIQRQHGVVAPHLTTEEFFEKTRKSPSFPKSTLDELIDFFRRADVVKFARIQTTLDAANRAIDSARSYIIKDNEIMQRRAAQARKSK